MQYSVSSKLLSLCASPALAVVFGLLLAGSSLKAETWTVGPVPERVRQELQLDDFYQKHTSVAGFSIVGSSRASDFALKEAAWILSRMLEGHEKILEAMAKRKVRLTVMAWNEFTTDVPEHSEMKPKVFWDRRARGLGGSPVSCAEENLLGYPGDPYSTENILIHEFAHAIHSHAMRDLDPTFEGRLRTAYKTAIDAGRWHGTYAGGNPAEYWAEAMQDWFDNNRENDGLHNHVNTRAELKAYDPALAALCQEVLGDGAWRYQKPALRGPEDRDHLAGFDPSQAPRFRWRDEPVPDKPRVLIQTAMGDIELALDTLKAPVTVTNFLHYVHQGLYADGTFLRTVTPSNQPADKVKIEVVQACADPAKQRDFLPPIPLERTKDTGLRHLTGTVSMARAAPDSAQDHFFICLSDQPELDFGGRRNPDGQGFAAFGQVVKGMDVARKIHSSPAQGQQLTPPIRIQRAIRLN
ncbi:MAG TPA: peptidylprolyl isomerase [Candidatus Paceibacterota bacterium]|nr:peptidylprolyl isomerase [Verrucomicrobiota bacterium]HRY50317.1 peptidylprolyl isomerase [Candidatus Paceibacterota bacterium]HSA01979.1 peptidylprolyl isomerase [Candidatus Paceibacterota bacterium]